MRLASAGFGVIASIIAVIAMIEAMDSVEGERAAVVEAGGATLGSLWDFWTLFPYIVFAIVVVLGVTAVLTFWMRRI